MSSQCVTLGFLLFFGLACCEGSDEAAPLHLIPHAPSNRILLRSERFINYTCRYGYVDLLKEATMTFSYNSYAKRNTEPVGGTRQLQCSNCREFGNPESAICTNQKLGESELSRPEWSCTADFKMRGIAIDTFEMDCVVDRASYFQNCVLKDSCILKISASPGYLWGYVLSATFFVAVIGILVFFGVKYCIERRKLRKGISPVPSDDIDGTGKAFNPAGDFPFIDDSLELPKKDLGR